MYNVAVNYICGDFGWSKAAELHWFLLGMCQLSALEYLANTLLRNKIEVPKDDYFVKKMRVLY